ncbi:YcfL family protein [Chimaeribacter californicus]|nr:YcfL family protein [Chimaeribacter californicus]
MGLALVGCSTPQKIALNTQQTVVMESPVLTAGIIADKPTIADASGRKSAASVLSNSQMTPVTVHYRFYWYDAQGLDLLPFQPPRTITLAPASTATIYSLMGNLDADSVRLYLYL